MTISGAGVEWLKSLMERGLRYVPQAQRERLMVAEMGMSTNSSVSPG
jgi:hypothetical protein